jgi:hypothetical protein
MSRLGRSAPFAALSILANGPQSFGGRKIGVLITDGADAALIVGGGGHCGAQRQGHVAASRMDAVCWVGEPLGGERRVPNCRHAVAAESPLIPFHYAVGVGCP